MDDDVFRVDISHELHCVTNNIQSHIPELLVHRRDVHQGRSLRSHEEIDRTVDDYGDVGEDGHGIDDLPLIAEQVIVRKMEFDHPGFETIQERGFIVAYLHSELHRPGVWMGIFIVTRS